MAADLISLPQTIWRDVLFGWLDGLRVIVRLDCALSSINTKCPLLNLYAERGFEFPDKAQDAPGQVLKGFDTWLRSRNVYICRLALAKCIPLIPEWKLLLDWSRETLLSLSLEDNEYKHISPFLSWAADSLKRLQKLNIENCDCSDPNSVDRLLQNNADTWTFIALSARGISSDTVPLSSDIGSFTCTKLPSLQVLRLVNIRPLKCREFLLGCPSLVVLFVYCVTGYCNALAEEIPKCCPTMKRLHLDYLYGLRGDLPMRIARSCPLLEYLSVTESHADFPELVQLLPRLRTLAGFTLSEATLLEIAAIGHPSLRILDVYTQFSGAGLRQFTAAMPQLKGLTVRMAHDAADFQTNALEFCGSLEILHVGACDDSIYTILESVAVHCPNLHTLMLDARLFADHCAKLDTVLQACLKLRTVRCYGFAVPLSRPALVQANYDRRLESWLPARPVKYS